jgi:hypothetical protein
MIDEVDVLIATPGHSMEAEYVKSLVNTISSLHELNISYRFINQYTSRVAAAREATAMDSSYLDAFNTKPVRGTVTYKKMFWIDSDISWDVADFIQMYESPHQIVSGIYLSDRGVPMFNPPEGKDLKEIIEPGKPFEVENVGFGFVCVKSGVFESIERPWFSDEFYKVTDEETGREKFIPYGEDYSWCIKARKAGFSIYIDPQVKVTHNKKVAIKP